MDSKVFDMKDFAPGSTAPPFHPWCRCATCPYFADMEGLGERFARDVETGERYKVPGDMTYKQWKAKQDEQYGEGTVDKARKKVYNKNADTEQFSKYKGVLRELSPETYDDFCRIKYEDPDGWENLKYQYRTLNRYELKGDVPAKTILELDNAAWYSKQKGFDFSKFSGKERRKLTKEISNGGNAASMLLDGKVYFSHSKFGMRDSFERGLYTGDYPPVVLSDKRKFDVLSLGDGIPRQYDTEAKFLEFVATTKKKNDTFTVTILSEKHICKSCLHVVSQFENMFPNSTVNIVSGKQNYNGSIDGLHTWKRRKKVK